MSRWEVRVGDVRTHVRAMESESFDACFSDLPYGLAFMGNRWDYSVPSVNVFVEILRVLKPGALAMFFGGTRTFHRVAVNVEDAGFWLSDTCAWFYGKGWPKQQDISKAIDTKLGAKRTEVIGYKQSGLDQVTGGHGLQYTGKGGELGKRVGKGRDPKTGLIPITAPVTPEAKAWAGYGIALKPGWEPILVGWKPFPGTYAENVLAHWTGALAIDASRVPRGSLPTNVALTHAEDCTDTTCGDNCPIRMLDAQSGEVGARAQASGPTRTGRSESTSRNAMNGTSKVAPFYADRGGASRFYYCSKVSREERDHGLEDFPDSSFGDETRAHGFPRRDGERGTKAKNDHPTLKPWALCRYYARLILPPPRLDGKPRRILVPYSGSGSEMIGCLQAGWDEVVGIELDPKHAEKARARIAKGHILANAASSKG